VLQLEYTQVALYEQALKEASLNGELRDFAEPHSNTNASILAAVKQALGSKAGPKPRFEFGSKTKSAEAFRQTAIKLGGHRGRRLQRTGGQPDQADLGGGR
jgi:hypothetical protein